jgi:hypothetical protein
MGWMKEIWKRTERMKKERGGEYKEKCIFFYIVIFFDKTTCRNRKARRANKANDAEIGCCSFKLANKILTFTWKKIFEGLDQ